jgi:hypothetical protein
MWTTHVNATTHKDGCGQQMSTRSLTRMDVQWVITADNATTDTMWTTNVRVRFMLFNATFNNISALSWQSVLLVKETGVPGENHRPIASHWQTLSHNVVSSTPLLKGN